MKHVFIGLFAILLLLGCTTTGSDSNNSNGTSPIGSISYVSGEPPAVGEEFSVEVSCPAGDGCEVFLGEERLTDVNPSSKKMVLIEKDWSEPLVIRLVAKTSRTNLFTLTVEPKTNSSDDGKNDLLEYYNCDSPDLLNASFEEAARDYFVAQKCTIGSPQEIPTLIQQLSQAYEKSCILRLDETAFEKELARLEESDQGDSCELFNQIPEMSASISEKIEGWKADLQSRINELTDKTKVFIPFPV